MFQTLLPLHSTPASVNSEISALLFSRRSGVTSLILTLGGKHAQAGANFAKTKWNGTKSVLPVLFRMHYEDEILHACAYQADETFSGTPSSINSPLICGLLTKTHLPDALGNSTPSVMKSHGMHTRSPTAY